MTLRELFVPNKFGTMPIIDVLGIGHIAFTKEGYCCLKVDKEESVLLDLDTKVRQSINNSYLYVELDRVKELTSKLRYVVPLTPENYLIHNAIKPIKEVMCINDGTVFNRPLTEDVMQNLRDDGSGWVERYDELVPVTFYIEDILYRLDLQGKLT